MGRRDRVANHDNIPHVPVLLNEMVHFLSPKSGEIYVDCTFGAGGYSKAILAVDGTKVKAIDQDPNSFKYATKLEEKYGSRFEFINRNFSCIDSILANAKVDGIVLDLGVSSMQLNEADRGFSFMQDGPLDMRMSCEGFSAADIVNNTPEDELANIIFDYGDEHASRKIARFICAERKNNPILTTSKLASIVRSAIGHRPGKIDPATKTFQAIRIWVNNEMGSLIKFLDHASDSLKLGGRLVVVTFHSTEDRIVKRYMQNLSEKKVARSKYAKDRFDQNPSTYKILTKKAVEPTEDEVKNNPRSRSGKLRAVIKINESSYAH
jgi:16S rRNA (cytosine1402-N4)-methyltransferase